MEHPMDLIKIGMIVDYDGAQCKITDITIGVESTPITLEVLKDPALRWSDGSQVICPDMEMLALDRGVLHYDHEYVTAINTVRSELAGFHLHGAKMSLQERGICFSARREILAPMRF
jgi:hypothetical protein